jgi:hypothetical protein
MRIRGEQCIHAFTDGTKMKLLERGRLHEYFQFVQAHITPLQIQ